MAAALGKDLILDEETADASALHDLHGPRDVGDITKASVRIGEDRDLDPVRDAAGVVAVLTADDLPAANDVSPSIHDEPLLSDGTVNYVGQPVFLVIAESHLAARST